MAGLGALLMSLGGCDVARLVAASGAGDLASRGRFVGIGWAVRRRRRGLASLAVGVVGGR